MRKSYPSVDVFSKWRPKVKSCVISMSRLSGAILLQKYSLTSIRNTDVYGIKTTKITVKKSYNGRSWLHSCCRYTAKKQSTTHKLPLFSLSSLVEESSSSSIVIRSTRDFPLLLSTVILVFYIFKI